MTLPSRIDEWFNPLSLRSPFDDLWPDPWTARLTRGLPDLFPGNFMPPVDLAETEKDIVITIEAPGMTDKDFDIQVVGHQVTVSGEKKAEEKTKGVDFQRIESRYGKFSRTIALPADVRPDDVDAVYTNGILTIKIPKVEPTPIKKIKIRSKGSK